MLRSLRSMRVGSDHRGRAVPVRLEGKMANTSSSMTSNTASPELSDSDDADTAEAVIHTIPLEEFASFGEYASAAQQATTAALSTAARSHPQAFRIWMAYIRKNSPSLAILDAPAQISSMPS